MTWSEKEKRTYETGFDSERRGLTYHKRYPALGILVPPTRRIYRPYTAQLARSVYGFVVLAYFELGTAEIV
jgi:hypothetical protein